jgi:hypothetical protein
MSMRPFFEAHRLAQTSKIGTWEGVFFEHLLHQWANHNKESNEIRSFSRVCWSTGTIEECVEQLSSPDVYWIPSQQNFPNIDSALVHNHTLFAFQMTILNTHKFDRLTFDRNFVEKVRVTCPLDRVVLYFVHPQEMAFRIPNNVPTSPPLTRLRSRIGFVARTLASRVGAQALIGEARPPHFECRTFGVNTKGDVELSDSFMELFRGLWSRSDGIVMDCARPPLETLQSQETTLSSCRCHPLPWPMNAMSLVPHCHLYVVLIPNGGTPHSNWSVRGARSERWDAVQQLSTLPSHAAALG